MANELDSVMRTIAAQAISLQVLQEERVQLGAALEAVTNERDTLRAQLEAQSSPTLAAVPESE